MNIINLDSVNSTNTYCIDLIKQGKADLPMVVVAREQSAGRGRYGNSFYSPADTGLYLSYAFSANYKVEDLLQITMVASATLHRILSQHCNDELTIKWINDIYRSNRKIAGILTECISDPKNPNSYYIIVGIGVNVCPNNIPSELSDVLGFLCDEKRDGLVDELAIEISDELNKVFADPNAAVFPALVEYYKSECKNLPADFSDELLDL